MSRTLLRGWTLTVPYFLEILGNFAKLLAIGLRDMKEACLKVEAAARRWRKDEQGIEGYGSLSSGKKSNVRGKMAQRFLLCEPTLSRRPLLSSHSEGRGQTAVGWVI